jgi:aminoglycoside phosphotransferase family enzyme
MTSLDLSMPDIDVPLPEKVAFLSSPAAYPDHPAGVTALETHMSWVFRTDSLVYKLKKPIRLEGLDFRTLAARHHFCCEEVRLNRRFTSDVYLGLTALTVDGGYTLKLDGSGPVVDWLVRMRRLPDQLMLDHALQAGTISPDDLRPVATRLAEFYRIAAPVWITARQFRTRFVRATRANIRELGRHIEGLDRPTLTSIAAGQSRFLDRHGDLLEERARAGRIVEGHGDLRPEHICLGHPPAVIDCLEFNRQFRILDPADELAFLALECERLGAPWAGIPIFDAYRDITGDDPAPDLITFYQCHRACTRAKLAIWHLTRNGHPNEPKWILRARDYLGRAARFAERLNANF